MVNNIAKKVALNEKNRNYKKDGQKIWDAFSVVLFWLRV